MVAPVTPGVNRSWKRRTPSSNGGDIQTWEFSQSGQRQKRPYTLPLEAQMSSFGVVSSSRTGYQAATPTMDSGQAYSVRRDWETNPSEFRDAYNKAYSKFKDAVGKSASVGTTLAEYKQSLSMISQRLTQLYEFQRQLRRFDFDGAARTLGLSAAPRSLNRLKYPNRRPHKGSRFYQARLRKAKKLDLRPGGKDLGNIWLEYHFGWSPLIKDIYDAIEVVSRPIPPDRICEKGTVKFKGTSTTRSGYELTSVQSEALISVKIGAYIKVVNPNLLLASQLGLVNPAAVAWELVPFSFLVDWFVNVGDVLNSYTDFFGLELSSSYHTKFSKSTWRRTKIFSFPGYASAESAVCEAIRFQRALGIGPGPFLKALPPKDLSVTRGATAISLLLQLLR